MNRKKEADLRTKGHMDRKHGSAWDCFYRRKHGGFYRRKHGVERRVGLLTGRAAPQSFSTKKNCRTNCSQLVITTENALNSSRS